MKIAGLQWTAFLPASTLFPDYPTPSLKHRRRLWLQETECIQPQCQWAGSCRRLVRVRAYERKKWEGQPKVRGDGSVLWQFLQHHARLLPDEESAHKSHHPLCRNSVSRKIENLWNIFKDFNLYYSLDLTWLTTFIAKSINFFEMLYCVGMH